VLSIGTGVHSDRCEEAVDVMETEIDRLRMHGVSNAELKLATGFIEGRTYLSEERNLAQARRLSGHELLGVPQSLDAYVHRIQEVTLDEIKASAREYLDPAEAVQVIVRP